ncbi:O-antigen ligase [Cesiribacter sp. SM1]|uniref:O-antigen ligase family protein n=1 Tax=Cesiribacter sp. SM1 TaxID=2861196 RepID=UPI001CD33949|nr:O-antigen ligase family protein [Cesiribacter sp. SM1]
MPQLINLLRINEGENSGVHPVIRSILLLLILLGGSIALTFLMVSKGWVFGVYALCLLIGLPMAWICFSNPLQALIASVILSYLIFVVRRISGIYDLPTGTVSDAILVIGVLGVMYRKSKIAEPLKNPITVAFFISIGYLFIQVANPNAFNIEAWLNLALRGIAVKVSVFVLSLHAFKTKSDVKNFTITCLAFAFIAALYGMYQELVGLPDFDLKWVMSDPVRYKLFFINGQLRKWSILGEVSSFGVIMAFSAITTLVLALGPYKAYKKVLLVIAALCMLVGMSYSGTRTAYVMVPVGIAFYVMLTITSRRTLVFAVIAFVAGVGLMFGPFYGGTLSRIRTAFQPSDDPSMQVREANRDLIQPYMHTHPMGGGVGTTSNAGKKYYPGHYLSGFPPDSGYMLTVLETGYIGLAITCWLYFVTLMIGVRNFFRSRDPVIKNYYAAYMAAFFAITIGNIAQNAVSYPPADIVNICILVLMFRLKTIDDNSTSTHNETIH